MTSTLASLGYSGIVNFPSRLSLYLLNYPWRFVLISLGYSGIVNFPSRLSLYLLNYPWRFVLISLSIIPTERRVQQCSNSGLAYSLYSGFSWHILDILT